MIGPQRVMWQEEQQGRPLEQLLLQAAALGPAGGQPGQQALALGEHPAADLLRREVTLPPREDLIGEMGGK